MARQMLVVDHTAEVYAYASTAVEVEAAAWLPSTGEVRVSAAPDVMDDPDQDGRQITGWVIMLVIESPVLRPRFISASRRIPDGCPPRPVVTELVRDCLRELAGARGLLPSPPVRPVPGPSGA